MNFEPTQPKRQAGGDRTPRRNRNTRRHGSLNSADGRRKHIFGKYISKNSLMVAGIFVVCLAVGMYWLKSMLVYTGVDN
jgi:hypothetical protein